MDMRNPRRRTAFAGSLVIILLIGGFCVEAVCGQIPVSAERSGKEIVVRVGKKVFTKYKFAESQKYPYFWPVNGPQSGKSVTTESSQPWPHHHSLFLGCDHVNGGNYWQDVNRRGQIVSKEVKLLQAKGNSVVIQDRCTWERPDHPAVFEDKRRFTLTAPSDAVRIIDADITLTALVDVQVTKTNHSLFSARVKKELSVKGGGTMINSAGQRGEKATFGRKAKWLDMSGRRDGVIEGIAILDHPKNPWSPCRWFTRDYGFMSPTPMNFLGKEGWQLAKGESVRLRYRVVVHQGSADEANLSALFDQWAGK